MIYLRAQMLISTLFVAVPKAKNLPEIKPAVRVGKVTKSQLFSK